jgi:hypothetical protein
VVCFDEESVSSTLEIGISDDMMQFAKSFDIGETVKIRVFLGYWHGCCRLQLLAGLIEIICSAKVVVR